MPVTPDYIGHLAAGNGRETACGEPWQGWQEPDDADLAQPSRQYRVAAGPSRDQQPRPGVDQVRQCQACQRVAMR